MSGLWRSAVAAALLVLAACTPSLNWRQVQVAQLAALLPCKPDHAERQVELLGEQRSLSMWGCEAGGSLFAVSRMPLSSGTPPEALMAAWQAAAVRNVRAKQDEVMEYKPPKTPRGGGLTGPMLRLVGERPDGQTVLAQLAWFSAAGEVYHLAVYGPQLTPAMLEPFFNEVHWL
jgi:hypothetical protein